MGRFVTTLSPEELRSRLMALNRKSPPGGGQLSVYIHDRRMELTFSKKSAKRKNRLTVFKGRIQAEKDGTATLRGHFGTFLPMCFLRALFLSLILFVLCCLPLGGKLGLGNASFVSFAAVFIPPLRSGYGGYIVLFLGLYLVSLFIMFYLNINAQERANRRVLRDYLTKTLCRQAEELH